MGINRVVERPSASFALLLVSGILIVFSGILISGFIYGMNPYRTRTSETTSLMFLDAIVCGMAVLISGILLFVLPKYHVIFGVSGFIFSVLSILSGGGLIIGIILGVIGGACGVDWKSGHSPTSLRYLHF